MNKRQLHLPRNHYAHGWDKDPFRTVSEINAIGLEYAELPDSPAKEDRLLSLMRAFHPYLMKYVLLIRLGNQTLWGGKVNQDTKKVLQLLMPKESANDRLAMLKTAHSLHLAFAGDQIEDIYDMLSMALLQIIKDYNPHYIVQVQQLVAAIESHVKPAADFSAEEINEELPYAADRCVRLLVRRGFLVQTPETKGRFCRTPGNWPPPDSFLYRVNTPMGMTYYIQRFFRYAFDDLVCSRRRDIESQHTVQLLGDKSCRATKSGVHDLIPNDNGNWVSNNSGRPNYDADISLMTQDTEDVSEMNLAWVESTNNPVFADLSREDRLILYMVHVQELPFKDIARTFDVSLTTIKTRYQGLLSTLRETVSLGVWPKAA